MAKFVKYSLCLLVALLSSCSPRAGFSTIPPKDIIKTNRVREMIGIRTIQSTWTFYGSEFGAEKWKNSEGEICKLVQRNGDNSINYEDDYYYGRVQE